MGRRRAAQRPVLAVLTLLLFASPSVAADRIQRSVAALEAFVPAAFLLIQGADTPFELGVIWSSVALQTVPNAVMLLGEAGDKAELTRITRWINFGIDGAIAGGLLGVGVAYLAGAFGPEADIRSRGATYLALSIPAAIAAFADFLPYSIEQSVGPAQSRSDTAEASPDTGS